MMMKIAKFAAAVAAAAALAGCPTGAGALIPGTGGSAAPTVRGADAALAAQCTSDKPAAATSVGATKHGRYANQTMPNAWDNLADETKVTEAVDAAMGRGGNEWNCFNKFYPGLLTVYYGIKGLK